MAKKSLELVMWDMRRIAIQLKMVKMVKNN